MSLYLKILGENSRSFFGISTPHMQDEYNRFNVTPQRTIPVGCIMTRNEALRVLDLGNSCSEREIRRKYRLLAREYHPDKWCESYVFSRSEGMEIFKSVANAFVKLSG